MTDLSRPFFAFNRCAGIPADVVEITMIRGKKQHFKSGNRAIIQWCDNIIAFQANCPNAMKSRKQHRMGTFYVRCKVENHVDRNKTAIVPKLLVDTGSDYTWIPSAVLEKIGTRQEKKDVSFVMANGQQITRSVGFAIIRLDKYFTIDEVVFAEKGDVPLLGARTLEGLNLTVDPKRKKLVASGPLLAARASILSGSSRVS